MRLRAGDVDFAQAPSPAHKALLAALAFGLAWWSWRAPAPVPPAPVAAAPDQAARRSASAPAPARPAQAWFVARDARLQWGVLFGALEAYRARQVTLRAVEPSLAQGLVRLEGEAVHAGALAAYVESLRGGGLQAPRLLRHEAMPGAEPGRLRFALEAGWPALPSSPGDGPEPAGDLPGQDDIPSLVAALSRLALAQGLTLRSVQHQWLPAGEAPRHLVLLIDGQGPYRAARELANRAVQLRPGVALIHLGLRAEDAPDQDEPRVLAVRMELRVHLREAA